MYFEGKRVFLYVFMRTCVFETAVCEERIRLCTCICLGIRTNNLLLVRSYLRLRLFELFYPSLLFLRSVCIYKGCTCVKY
jgi:hypothetical protein